jgi:HAD superfamily hydrolase (TIGR01490 family)
MQEKRIAIFDFDGTITPKDTFIEFIKYVHGPFKYYWFLFTRSPLIAFYYLRIIPNHRLKEIFFSYFFKGWEENALRTKGEQFCDELITAMCFPAALQVLESHKQRNDDILILTASSDIWLGKWCQDHKFQIIGTNYQIENGIITGKIAGKNCHGKEKWERIKTLIRSYDYSYGYGDSQSDMHFISPLTEQYFFPLNDANVKKFIYSKRK